MNESLYERVKQYKNQQLSEAEREVFESELKNNPTLAAEATELAAIYQGLQEKGDEALNAQLLEFGQQLLLQENDARDLSTPADQPLVARRWAIPRWAYAAAALLLLLLIALPLYQRLNKPEITYASAESLFTEYYTPPALPAVRDAVTSTWRTAYEQKKYPEAIAALEKLLADPNYPRQSEANLFLGLSYLNTGNTTAAIAAFQEVSPASVVIEDAQWYQALAYLKAGDANAAENVLHTIIATPSHPYLNPATDIIKRLK